MMPSTTGPSSAESPRDGAAVPLDDGARLAYERTYLAHERTQMAWIRTALSLISFGFTIAKFFELLQTKPASINTLVSAQGIGVIMISTGIIALCLGSMQHWVATRRLHARCPGLPRSVSWVTAVLLMLLGLVALVNAVVQR